MNESHNPKRSIHRRDLLKGAAAVSLGLASGALGIPKTFGQASVGANRIQLENAKPGTRDWMLTNTLTDPERRRSNIGSGRCPWIEGYCSGNSVRSGETLQIMVSTDPETEFNLEIFRTGYYNGADPVPNPLLDPTVQLVRLSDGATIGTNDNWEDDAEQKTLIESTGIPPSDSRESAMVTTVDPGTYSFVVRGAGDTTGFANLEIYEFAE